MKSDVCLALTLSPGKKRYRLKIPHARAKELVISRDGEMIVTAITGIVDRS